MKSVVALQNEVNRVNRDAEKVVSRLKEECKEKIKQQSKSVIDIIFLQYS